MAEIDDAVRLLASRGLHCAAIARAVGRNESSVRGRLKRLGLSAADGKRVPHQRGRLWRERLGDAAAGRACALCEALGWPEACAPSHARILTLLLEGGPNTHAGLCGLLGWKLAPKSAGRFQSRPLAAALRALAVQGLVVKLPKAGGQVVRYDLAPWLRANREYRE